jgi:hypothetical protein
MKRRASLWMVAAFALCLGSACSGADAPPPPRQDGVPCLVKLTQGDNAQTAKLRGRVAALRFATPGLVEFTQSGDCPDDLSVLVIRRPHSGGMEPIGEPDGGTLLLKSKATDLILAYQPCHQQTDRCWGPNKYKEYPLDFGS